MRFDYHFGGLLLHSDIALPGLIPAVPGADGAPIVRITAEIGSPVEPERVCCSWPGRYELTLGEQGDRWLMRSRFDGSFLIDRDGGAVHIVAASLPLATEILEVLLRRVLPRVPILRGATAIHAASLSIGGRSLMLIGRSGAGKSTLTAALASRPGWHILGDDISQLWDRGGPMMAAGTASVSLWPASRDGLNLDPAQCTPIIGYGGKVRYEPDVPPAEPLAPLGAVIFLDRSEASDTPRLDPVPLAEAVPEAIPQLIRFNEHGESARERVDGLLAITAAMRACPPLRLVYPGRFDALPTIEAMLRDLLAG